MSAGPAAPSTADGDRRRWDARHAEGRLDAAPAAWVATHGDLLAARAPGRALDLACGLGRNAVFLAGLGFHVTALDVSGVAVQRLARHAAAAGLAIEASRADLRRAAALPEAAFDVVVCTSFLERALLGPMARALAPGGVLLLESFTTAQADRPRGPSQRRMLLEPGELRGAFPALEVLHEREQDADGLAVAGIVARRPG